MLQQVEYNPKKFLDWVEQLFKANQTVKSVMYRQRLVKTPKALLLILFSVLVFIALVGVALWLPDPELSTWFYVVYSLSALFVYPFMLLLSLALVSSLARLMIVKPAQARHIHRAQKIFANHKGAKVAVIGSYGKTTMKELLVMILSEGKKVAATPGNKNTALSQARFAQTLAGDEDVIIVEFGEGEPGDVVRMTELVQPDYAVVTGLAPNHLDFYESLKDVAKDLLSITKRKETKTYATSESSLLQPFLTKNTSTFSASSVMGWKISRVLVSVTQTSFTMKKGNETMKISCGLLGRHQVAPVAFGAALARELGLSKTQVEGGCTKILPFEHRMQPQHVDGAWIIDDTYNGNIEGLQAGLKLLGELDFKRKWYVTPGLVDQGEETERVHTKLGETIVAIQPDIVVLMDNSARPIIEKAMKEKKFKGELRIEKKPLEFYLNIEHQLAAGDLVMMQNDWTDNYN